MSQSRPDIDNNVEEEKKPTQSFLHNLVTDSAPGTAVALTLFPFESLKKYVQRNGHYPWSWGAGSATATQGFLNSTKLTSTYRAPQRERFVPYRGASVFAANVVPTTAIQLTMNRILNPLTANGTETQKAAAAAVCGLAGAFTATAMENYVLNMQQLNAVRFANNPLAKPATIPEVVGAVFAHKPYGPLTGYTGVGLRDSIFTVYMFYANPRANKLAKEKFGVNSPGALAVGIGSGLIGAGLSHPGDTVATAMQESNNAGPQVKQSFVSTAKRLYQEGGVARFYRGYPSRALLFTVFANGIPYVQKGTDKALKYGEERLMELARPKAPVDNRDENKSSGPKNR